MGRPALKPRTPLGQRIMAARQQLGLTQRELADKVGTTQRVVAYWEREAVSLRADQINSLASILQVSIDQLVKGSDQPKRGNGGPIGKARRIFEEVSKLPRHQQQRIVGVVEDMIAAQRLTAKAA